MSLEAVARRAKVSTATVSRVLNNAELVKATTRARVVRAMADLNYHPNLHARTLAGGKSRTIGMIVSNLDNPFFLDIFRSVEDLATAQRYDVVVANTGYKAEQLVRSIRLMIGRRVAGLAAIVSEMEASLFDDLAASGIPVVVYDVGIPRPNIVNVRVNYRRGIEKLVTYLQSLGHERLGFIGHHSSLGPINDRVQSLVEMVRRQTPKLEALHVADSDGLDGGRRAARELLRLSPKATAIVCVNDIMAVGALRELREQGKRVPQDISITGFDNIKLSEYCDPPLTTVHIPRDTIGEIVYQSLVTDADKIREAGREIMIDPELVVRDSTGPASR